MSDKPNPFTVEETYYVAVADLEDARKRYEAAVLHHHYAWLAWQQQTAHSDGEVCE